MDREGVVTVNAVAVTTVNPLLRTIEPVEPEMMRLTPEGISPEESVVNVAEPTEHTVPELVETPDSKQ